MIFALGACALSRLTTISPLIRLHSERPKLFTILAFLSVIGLS